MHPSTPPADCGTDPQPYPVGPTGRHGDVDTNGDLVDELDQRLASAINPAWPGIFEAQLAGIRRMLRGPIL